MDEKITCPRCKGCGVVNTPRKRSKSIKSLNPNEKFCAKCKAFKVLDDFYKVKGRVSGYCRKCQCSKVRTPQAKEQAKARKYKYDCTCEICGKPFLGRKKDQILCSRECNMYKINYKIFDRLSNESTKQLKDEGFNLREAIQ